MEVGRPCWSIVRRLHDGHTFERGYFGVSLVTGSMQQVNFPLRTAESSSRSSMGIRRWGVTRVKKQVALKL